MMCIIFRPDVQYFVIHLRVIVALTFKIKVTVPVHLQLVTKTQITYSNYI